MRIAGATPCSLNNGYGLRYVLYLQGCGHKCKGCHNESLWDFNGGREVEIETLVNDILKYDKIDGLTLSGGDPFYQHDECVKLLSQLREKLPNKGVFDIWIYTGFKWENIKNTKLAMMADYIVDGKFESDKKIDGEMYGSYNQRIINVNRKLAQEHFKQQMKNLREFI